MDVGNTGIEQTNKRKLGGEEEPSDLIRCADPQENLKRIRIAADRLRLRTEPLAMTEKFVAVLDAIAEWLEETDYKIQDDLLFAGADEDARAQWGDTMLDIWRSQAVAGNYLRWTAAWFDGHED
jgi:hypothetical protein